METLSMLLFLFLIGGFFGWTLELIYRRIIHKRWINPGFLSGPFLPIYGFGTVVLYLLCSIDLSFIEKAWLRYAFLLLLIALSMTLIEYLTGIIFIKGMKIKLWDYSKKRFNIQGIIAPEYSLAWLLIGAGYAFLLHGFLKREVGWFLENPYLLFPLGLFYGMLLIDFSFSIRLVARVRAWAAHYNLVVRYEQFKSAVRKHAKKMKLKKNLLYFFREKDMEEELERYIKKYHKE